MLGPRSRSLVVALSLSSLVLGVSAACGDDAADTDPTVLKSEASAAGDVARPVANEDHWHASFDVYVCDGFVGPLHDTGPDIAGIHSHGDGLVHIHPWLDSAAGANATFGLFAEQIGLGVDDGAITVPEQFDPEALPTAPETWDEPASTTWRDGDACPAGPGRVTLFVWPAGAPDDAEPTEVSPRDIGATRFSEDGQRFVLAFTPEGVVPPQPPSTPELEAPGDMEPGGDVESGSIPPELEGTSPG